MYPCNSHQFGQGIIFTLLIWMVRTSPSFCTWWFCPLFPFALGGPVSFLLNLVVLSPHSFCTWWYWPLSHLYVLVLPRLPFALGGPVLLPFCTRWSCHLLPFCTRWSCHHLVTPLLFLIERSWSLCVAVFMLKLIRYYDFLVPINLQINLRRTRSHHDSSESYHNFPRKRPNILQSMFRTNYLSSSWSWNI